MGHRRGEDRKQAALFPVMLDELVPEEALVRIIDAWVDSLDVTALGFAKAQAAPMGRPPYDPADLLKLYAGRGRCRHWYEEALDANAKRVIASPHMMALRRQTVEHPFGTIKHRILGNARLLVRGLQGARAELSLAVLAYNFKRMINMKGSAWMLQALRA